jgi:hypothetical protein
VEVVWFCPDHVDVYADGSLKLINLILSSGVWAPVLSVRTTDEHSALTADLSIVGLVRLGPLPLQASSAFPLPFQSDHSNVSHKFLLSVPQWSETRGDVESVMPRVLQLLANLFRSVLKSWSKNLYKKERTAAVAGRISPQLGNFVFLHELVSEGVECQAPLCCAQPIEYPVRNPFPSLFLSCRTVPSSIRFPALLAVW